MRRTLPIVTAAALLLAAWVTYASGQAPRPAGGNPARAWEYRVLVLTDVLSVPQALSQAPAKSAAVIEAKFNELGRDGWEYCGDLPGTALFKRPKP